MEKQNCLKHNDFTGFAANECCYRCIACDCIINNEDFFMILMRNDELSSGLKPELFGANNHSVVANVFLCWTCGKKGGSQKVEIDPDKLYRVNHGPDNWTTAYKEANGLPEP